MTVNDSLKLFCIYISILFINLKGLKLDFFLYKNLDFAPKKKGNRL